jgi:hypothetical protein
MKIYRVDIDETICFYPEEREYIKAVPDYENIAKVNELYDAGHTIIYWTARGSRSGIDWTELTKKQLNDWGAKHHELYCDKPYYDIFVEDRSIRIEEL